MTSLAVLILIWFCEYIEFCKAENEYVLNFDSPIYVCPDEQSQAYVESSEVEVKRHNETTTYMSGPIRFIKGLDHNTMVELIVEKDLGGSFEMIMSHEICDLCQELGNPDSLYYNYLKYIEFPEECPIEPNAYQIHDLIADTKDMPINSVTSGRYQVTVNFYNNPEGNCQDEKTFVACLKFDFIIEPL